MGGEGGYLLITCPTVGVTFNYLFIIILLFWGVRVRKKVRSGVNHDLLQENISKQEHLETADLRRRPPWSNDPNMWMEWMKILKKNSCIQTVIQITATIQTSVPYVIVNIFQIIMLGHNWKAEYMSHTEE